MPGQQELQALPEEFFADFCSSPVETLFDLAQRDGNHGRTAVRTERSLSALAELAQKLFRCGERQHVVRFHSGAARGARDVFELHRQFVLLVVDQFLKHIRDHGRQIAVFRQRRRNGVQHHRVTSERLDVEPDRLEDLPVAQQQRGHRMGQLQRLRQQMENNYRATRRTMQQQQQLAIPVEKPEEAQTDVDVVEEETVVEEEVPAANAE